MKSNRYDNLLILIKKNNIFQCNYSIICCNQQLFTLTYCNTTQLLHQIMPDYPHYFPTFHPSKAFVNSTSLMQMLHTHIQSKSTLQHQQNPAKQTGEWVLKPTHNQDDASDTKQENRNSYTLYREKYRDIGNKGRTHCSGRTLKPDPCSIKAPLGPSSLESPLSSVESLPLFSAPSRSVFLTHPSLL